MDVNSIYKAVLSYNAESVEKGVAQALDSDISIDRILSEGLISAMDEVGKRFSDGEIFVPEMLMAAEAMKKGMGLLKPLLAGTESESRGTVVIGTVKGDLHDIGKNLVTMMLEGGGFNVIDLGVDVASDVFVDAVKNNNAEVVALSALLTTTMPAMKETVAALAKAGLKSTIVGGAPVTEEFAHEIGAAGYSKDAPGAVVLTRQLLEAA